MAAISLPTALRAQAGPDLWWQVYTGKRILSARAVPGVDDLSFTASGQPWANHEWLSQVMFAIADNLGGGVGLILLRAMLFIGTVVGLVLVVNRRVDSPGLTLAIVAPIVVVSEPFLNVRAHTFTYLLIPWTILALDRLRDGRKDALVVLPVIVLAWTNLHGGFVVGLALIGLTIAHLMVARNSPVRKSRLVALGATCVAVTVLNPSGTGLYRYLAGELGANHSLITEWQPARGGTLVLVLVLVVVPLCASALARRFPSPAIAVMVPLSAIGTMRYSRFLVVLALISAVAIADVAKPAIARFATARSRAKQPRGALTAVGMLAVASTSVMVFQAPQRLDGLTAIDDGAPAGAANFLAAADFGPNLVSHLDWGGYLIWRLDGRYLVSIDGRNLTVYGDDWVDDYLRAMQAGTLLEVEGVDQADAWLLRSGSAQVQTLADDPRWVEAYRDDQAVVFAPEAQWSGPPERGSSAADSTVYFE